MESIKLWTDLFNKDIKIQQNEQQIIKNNPIILNNTIGIDNLSHYIVHKIPKIKNKKSKKIIDYSLCSQKQYFEIFCK